MTSRIDREALTVAMAVVPGIYSRNKHFSLYTEPEAKRARARAAQIRGIARQITGGPAGGPGGHSMAENVHLARSEEGCVLTYAVPSLHLDRRVVLTALEASCVAYLVRRAGGACLGAPDVDRARIDAALRRLASGLRLDGIETGSPGE